MIPVQPETGRLPSTPFVFPREAEISPEIGLLMTRAEIERDEWLDK
ncbi:MAG: hypothetical protein LUQ31_09125 [Methanoregula sp.]|nr:hypothetical protein [Methanoregula sp.]